MEDGDRKKEDYYLKYGMPTSEPRLRNVSNKNNADGKTLDFSSDTSLLSANQLFLNENQLNTAQKQNLEDTQSPRSRTNSYVDQEDSCAVWIMLLLVLITGFGILFYIYVQISSLLSTPEFQQVFRDQKYQTAMYEFPVSLKDMYSGGQFAATLSQQSICSHCHGDGAEPGYGRSVCGQCDGYGYVLQMHNLGGMKHQIKTTCPRCKGRGQTIGKYCTKCHGRRVVKKEHQVEFTIQPGVQVGDVVTLVGEGNEAPRYLRGDVVFKLIESKKDSGGFVRHGHDLHINLRISLKEALLGFKHTIEHLDEHVVSIVRDGVTHPEEIINVEKEGMPVVDHPTRFGALYVKCIVVYPESLQESDRKVIEELL